MKLQKFFILITLCLSISIAQTTTISGLTLDADSKEPLGFVQVVVQESTLGTVSNQAGEFRLENVPTGRIVLTASYIGYQQTEISLDTRNEQFNNIIISIAETPISMEEILVSATTHISATTQNYSKSLNARAPRDVGDFFKSIPNGSAVKKGGYALDPNFRGFMQDQLNVQFDGGIKIWGGCPNRMDPPTSHIQSDDLEKIEVIQGPFSVRWGQALGGIVNLVMRRPERKEALHLNGSANVGYESNGNNARSRVSLMGGVKQWDFYLGGGAKSYHDYTTGIDSIEIPSEYEIKDYSAKLAYNFSEDSRLQISSRQARVADVDFPALPMDARKDASDILSLDYTIRNLTPLISSMSSKVYVTRVGHVMDNYNRSNSAMVESVTDADTRTTGGRLEVGLRPQFGQNLYLGLDYYSHNKQGYRERFVKTNPCNTAMHPNKTFVDSVWQDAAISDLGSFLEFRSQQKPHLSYTMGARFDQVTASIGEPATNFFNIYGDDDRWTESNFSAFGIVEYTPSPILGLSLAAGRGTRSADISERFVNHLPVGVSSHEHFGNPDLLPEINTQIEIGISTHYLQQHLKGNVFISNLDNYIFARVDSSMNRIFLPCQTPEVTKVFQNLDQARKVGFELLINGQLMSDLSYDYAIAYTRGENLDADTPLPQIAPLKSMLNIRYQLAESAWIQGEAQWAGSQDRVSVEFGETETSGFSVYNIKSGITVLNNIYVDMALNNIFDVVYFEHLSRNFAKNTPESGLPLYEPGRNFIVGITYEF